MKTRAKAHQFKFAVLAAVLFAFPGGALSAPQTNDAPASVEVPSDPKAAASGPAAATPPRQRPRTLTAVQRHKDHTHSVLSSAGNSAVMPVERYDAVFVAAVQQRWQALLDAQPAFLRQGEPVLEFKLNADGSIADLQKQAGAEPLLGVLCERAVLDAAPYAAWPPEMRRAIGAGSRRVTITFCSIYDDPRPTRFRVRAPEAHLFCDLRYHARAPARVTEGGNDDYLYLPLPGVWSPGWGCFNPAFDQSRWEKEVQKEVEKDIQRWRDSLPRCPQVPVHPK